MFRWISASSKVGVMANRRGQQLAV